MLEWMQRNKKYLVITSWVSVIALIFGMVSWSPSDFSFGDDVAKVGKIKISNQEFQYAFQKTFNEYNEMVGGNLDIEQAKQFKLDKIALQQLIQKARLQNFALELGLRVQDQEIVDTISKNEIFFTNGVFDSNLYRKILKENHLSVKFFEQSIRESLLIQKLLELFPSSVTSLEQESIGGTIALTDTITYQVLPPFPIQQVITEQKIKDFWEKNKEKYTNPPKIILEVTRIPIKKQQFDVTSLQKFYNENKTLYLDSNGQLLDFSKVEREVQKHYQEQKAKENALRFRAKFRKSETKDLDTEKLTIVIDDSIPQDLAMQLKDLKEGDILNPIIYQKDYIVGSVLSAQAENIKDFVHAKKQAQKDLQREIMLDELKVFAQKQLPSFKGNTIQINNLARINFKDLDEKHTQFVIHTIFASPEKNGVIMLDNQAFLYRITKQILPSQVPNNLLPLVQNIKGQYISQVLLDYLFDKYPTKIYSSQISQGGLIE